VGGQGRSAQELSRRFIDGFNRRDAEALIALCHPDIEFCPTILVGGRAIYVGHDGLRRWVGELIASGGTHEARIRAVRELGVNRLVVLTEVMLEDEVVSPSAMVVGLRDGLIIHVQAYLSDEQTLVRVGVLPPQDASENTQSAHQRAALRRDYRRSMGAR
jgi:SnoaL-like domain